MARNLANIFQEMKSCLLIKKKRKKEMNACNEIKCMKKRLEILKDRNVCLWYVFGGRLIYLSLLNGILNKAVEGKKRFGT